MPLVILSLHSRTISCVAAMLDQHHTIAIAGRYTVTFSYDGDFDLPDNQAECRIKTPLMVLNALENGLFKLVDFNLSGHYNNENAESYLQNRLLHRSVAEITLLLTLQDLASREAIFQKCVLRLRSGDLEIIDAAENDVPEQGILQSLIRFEEI